VHAVSAIARDQDHPSTAEPGIDLKPLGRIRAAGLQASNGR
jgi:hypothetical protein